ncbi:hypothetical protein ACFQ44_06035 [Levilactobacillus lanxiensis]|uniref:10 kDa chaperonin n=1 Tax=Levilactobacillus lanxiensis TaxID=2799568 RepID=A0ABW4D102_9LACO|nr:hypothetical protein [Levilactobacillus lanxiensis]
MKTGASKLNELIDLRVSLALADRDALYRAFVTDTSPLTVQPKVMTTGGKKHTPVRGVKRLDWGGTRELAVGDEVLVGVLADSDANDKKGKTYIADENRRYSIDSSIVIGVIK